MLVRYGAFDSLLIPSIYHYYKILYLFQDYGFTERNMNWTIFIPSKFRFSILLGLCLNCLPQKSWSSLYIILNIMQRYLCWGSLLAESNLNKSSHHWVSRHSFEFIVLRIWLSIFAYADCVVSQRLTFVMYNFADENH